MIELVLIDPGHGGLIEGEYQTAGKRATIDDMTLYEGVLNRAQAHLLNYMLSLEGIKSEVIVPENEDVSLKARAMRMNKIAKQYDPGAVLGLCIHSNAFHSPRAKGWEVWTSFGQTDADDYAQVFYESFVNEFGPENIRMGVNGVDKDGPFYMCRATNCPVVYIEDLFMTNPDDFKILTDPVQLAHLVRYKVAAIKQICGLHEANEVLA